MIFPLWILVLIFIVVIAYSLRKSKLFRNKRKWRVLLFVSLLILFLGNWTSIYINITLLFEHLPEEFSNYSHISDLDDAFLKANFKTIKFESIYEEEAVIVNDSIIILKTHQEDSLTSKINVSWYKINPSGVLIDSLIFKNEYIENVDSYLVNKEKDYYISWIKNGDTLKKFFVLLEEGKLLDKAQSEEYLKDAAYSNYDYFYENKNNREDEERFMKVIFYKNNEWFQFYAKDDLHITVDRYYSNTGLEFKDWASAFIFKKTNGRVNIFQI